MFLQIASCDICQRINKKLTTGVPELNPVPVKTPWHHIGINFVGPISPPGKDGSLVSNNLQASCVHYF